jgi:hypothetical protein
MRRRILILLGLAVFFALIISVPTILILHRPASCFDGVQNQGETAIDRGGPCLLLDDTRLTPHAILWARAFKIRDGLYDATTYVVDPNTDAGVVQVKYRMGLYDSENVLVAERIGTTFLMPDGVTPVFEGDIDTGHRDVNHVQFSFLEPLVWERMRSVASDITVHHDAPLDVASTPRLNADVTNTSVADMTDLSFVAVVFDPEGNAFASSATALSRLNAGDTQKIVFTWPAPFASSVGRVDVIAVHAPQVGLFPPKQ